MLPTKPVPATMHSDAPAQYLDPPAEISEIFGGRDWFTANATVVHRIGIFRGLGWKSTRPVVPETKIKYEPVTPGLINGVRVLKLGPNKFNLSFGEFVRGTDNLDLPVFHSKIFCEHVTADQLKPKYEEVFGA